MEEPLSVLNQARSSLHHENAVIAQEERSLWLQMLRCGARRVDAGARRGPRSPDCRA
jgi:hypothetical protein